MPRTAKPPRLITIDKAAEYIGCSRNSIRRRISEGTFTAYRIGPRMVRLDIDEIEAALRPIPTINN